jgi:uncharacterized protein (DUF608 family)
MKISFKTSLKTASRSGVYVGGIGSGGFEVRADGLFYCRQMFNEWRKRDMFEALFIHSKGTDECLLSTQDLSWTGERLAGVEQVEYTGEFPKVTLRYPQRNMTIEFTSIFIPGDLKNSSLPAVHLRIKGKGRLQFLVPTIYKAVPRLDGKTLMLQSEEGALGVWSGKGKLEPYPQRDRWIAGRRIMDPTAHWRPAAIDEAHACPCFAGMYWEGNIDDEVIIAWHFPDSRDNEGNFMGQWYTNHFSSCKEVLDYMVANKRTLLKKTEKYHRSIYGSTQPAFVKDAYSSQLSEFIKQSWHTKDGLFGVWEGGCCCCGLQTTDVAYYGSWLYAEMFPELDKAGLRLTAKFQRDDGWIPHFFPGTFNRIDEYRRKDMNMQFVLMVWRDYYITKDKAFLDEMYPFMKKAMECTYGWDKDGDMLPEVEPAAQTFDSWHFSGCAIYTASLWLAALKAMAKISPLAGDHAYGEKCVRDYETAKTNVIAKLWNGRYFILADDAGKKDEGCLLDALTGDWYCRMTGLGKLFDDIQVVSHLKACIKLNRKPIDPATMKEYRAPGEKGYCYINGGYPDNRNAGCQAFEPWTGMEYAFAIHLHLAGMKKEALQVIKEVHDRKESCGLVWNHIECGTDYYRPMVIGGFWKLLGAKRK